MAKRIATAARKMSPPKRVKAEAAKAEAAKATTQMQLADLPLDILLIIFGYLPLSEVLKHLALVCRSFYRVHTTFCRNQVKRLTIVGRYLAVDTKTKAPALRTEDQIHQHLFTFARRQPAIDASCLNPKLAHLYLSINSQVKRADAVLF